MISSETTTLRAQVLKKASINLKLPDAMTSRFMVTKAASRTRIRVNEDLPVVDDDVKTIIAGGGRAPA